jgi:hypothetical protein
MSLGSQASTNPRSNLDILIIKTLTVILMLISTSELQILFNQELLGHLSLQASRN